MAQPNLENKEITGGNNLSPASNYYLLRRSMRHFHWSSFSRNSSNNIPTRIKICLLVNDIGCDLLYFCLALSDMQRWARCFKS
jgi:hypothetical protein